MKHARDLLSKARHDLSHAAGGTTSPAAPAFRDIDGTEQDDMTGAEQFDSLEGPTDAELAEQAA